MDVPLSGSRISVNFISFAGCSPGSYVLRNGLSSDLFQHNKAFLLLVGDLPPDMKDQVTAKVIPEVTTVIGFVGGAIVLSLLVRSLMNS